MGHSVWYTIIFNKYFRFPIPEVPRHSSSKRQAAKSIIYRMRFTNRNSLIDHKRMVIEKRHVEKM